MYVRIYIYMYVYIYSYICTCILQYQSPQVNYPVPLFLLWLLGHSRCFRLSEFLTLLQGVTIVN